MSFLNLGLAAAGAACVAIPIIIHLLFRRRRKPVVWAAMRFLLEAYRKHQRRLRLEQWLLLATRALLVLLIAMAVGRPLVSDAARALGAGGSRTLYLLIDNGLASSARPLGAGGSDQSALARHQATAERLLDALGPSDRAGLIAMGAPAQPLVVPASSDIGAVRSLVRRLEPTDGATDIAGALATLRAEIEAEAGQGATDQAHVVVLSDFLTGSGDVSRPLPAALTGLDGLKVSLSRPAEEGAPNVQALGVAPLRSVVVGGESGGEQARVRLRRTGPAVSEAAATTVRVRLGGADAAPGAAAESVVRWQAGQSEASTTVQIDMAAMAPGAPAALIAEIDADAVAGDNRFIQPVIARDALRVGVAASRRFGGRPSIERLTSADWLRLALRPTETSPVSVVEVDPSAIDAPTLARLDALVLPRPDRVTEGGWGRIDAFAREGGLVLVFPPPDVGVHLWTDDMTQALGLPWRIAREALTPDEPWSISDEPERAGLLRMIAAELPDLVQPVTVSQAVLLEQLGPESEVALRLANGEPWIITAPPGAGDAADPDADAARRGLIVYVATAPTLTWTDLVAKPLMVPLMQELVRQGVGSAASSGAAEAGRRPLAPAGAVELRRGPQQVISVDERGRASTPIRQAGLFEAIDERGRVRSLLAVNADPDAGRTDPQSPAAVRTWFAETGVEASSIGWLETGEGDQGAAAAALEQSGDAAGLSLPLLVLALVAAGAELVMARFFSHAVRESGGRSASPAPASGGAGAAA